MSPTERKAMIRPYLLRKLPITRPNHVWCSDITYIPVRRGFLYLVAIMDWATRKVLAWRLSKALTKTQLLILDDWGPDRLNASQRRDLMEIVEDRYGNGSTLITSQLPLSTWHEVIGETPVTMSDLVLKPKLGAINQSSV